MQRASSSPDLSIGTPKVTIVFDNVIHPMPVKSRPERRNFVRSLDSGGGYRLVDPDETASGETKSGKSVAPTGITRDGNCIWPLRAVAITGHSLNDVRSILDAHYLHRDPELARAAINKPEIGYCRRLAETKTRTESSK